MYCPVRKLSRFRYTRDYIWQFLCDLRLIKIHGFCHSNIFSSFTCRSGITNQCTCFLVNFLFRFFERLEDFCLIPHSRKLPEDIPPDDNYENHLAALLFHTFLNYSHHTLAHFPPFFDSEEQSCYFDIVENIMARNFLVWENLLDCFVFIAFY